MKRRERHPRITPLKALGFLQKLEAAGNHPLPWLLNDLKEALSNHVKAALVQKRRRRSKI